MKPNEEPNHTKDWCTGFPEYWYQWYLKWGWLPAWRKIYIGDCCKDHDEDCSTVVFMKCLWKKNVVGRVPIVGVASTACLIKYGKV